MKNNFECRYKSVGGTFCFYYDKDIIDDLKNNECDNCEINNYCDCCDWKKIMYPENCKSCSIWNEIIDTVDKGE